MQPYATKKRDNHSFTAFLNRLRSDGLFEYAGSISGFELAELASRLCKSNGKAIYIKEEIPTVLNLFASPKRIEMALGMSAKETTQKAEEFIKTNPATSLTLTQTDVYHSIKLSALPIKKHYKGDVSGSINMGCVISEGQKCGLYRIQPISDRKAVMHCLPNSGLAKQLTKDLPVTVAVGTSPHLIFASAAKLPESISELELASFLHPEEMLFIETERFPVPAETQIIIQGTVSATEKHPEGPFYNYTDSYSEVSDFPLMDIESVRIIENGVYHTTVTGKKPMEATVLLEAVSAISPQEEEWQR